MELNVHYSLLIMALGFNMKTALCLIYAVNFNSTARPGPDTVCGDGGERFVSTLQLGVNHRTVVVRNSNSVPADIWPVMDDTGTLPEYLAQFNFTSYSLQVACNDTSGAIIENQHEGRLLVEMHCTHSLNNTYNAVRKYLPTS